MPFKKGNNGRPKKPLDERLLPFTIRLNKQEQEMASKLNKYHNLDSVGRLFAQYMTNDLLQIKADRQKAAELATIDNKPKTTESTESK